MRVKVEEIIRTITYIEIDEKNYNKTKLQYKKANKKIVKEGQGYCRTITRYFDGEEIRKDSGVIKGAWDGLVTKIKQNTKPKNNND